MLLEFIIRTAFSASCCRSNLSFFKGPESLSSPRAQHAGSLTKRSLSRTQCCTFFTLSTGQVRAPVTFLLASTQQSAQPSGNLYLLSPTPPTSLSKKMCDFLQGLVLIFFSMLRKTIGRAVKRGEAVASPVGSSSLRTRLWRPRPPVPHTRLPRPGASSPGDSSRRGNPRALQGVGGSVAQTPWAGRISPILHRLPRSPRSLRFSFPEGAARLQSARLG